MLVNEKRNWIVDLVTAGVLLYMVYADHTGDTKLQHLREHVTYQWKRMQRTVRQYTEPAWRTELRDYIPTETLTVDNE